MFKSALTGAFILAATGAGFAQQAQPNEGVSAVDPTAVTTQVTEIFVTPAEADFVVTQLINENVHNLQGEDIGTIEDFVIRDGTTVTGVIVSVGGFLGIGQTYVVIDPSAVTLSLEGAGDDAEWEVVVDTNRESLEGAPTFEYEGRWER